MNILEFARRAGVSTATISRAFHEPEKLKPDTREHILSLASRLGYYPSAAGRTLVTGRHDVLGLIWPLEVEGADALFAQRVLAALTRQLVAHDLDLLICPIDRDQAGTMEHAHRTLRRSRCDAWLLLYPRPEQRLISSLAASGKPVICLMGHLEECPDWKWVRLDQRNWIENALRRLVAASCRSALFFGARPDEPDHMEREKAFREIAPRFFKRRATVITGPPGDASRLREHLAAGGWDAVIGADDAAALLAIETCTSCGLSVPEKVKVTGIDDVPSAAISSPTLSTFRQPIDEMVGCAVELALGRRRRSKLFDATFVGRESLP